MARYRSGLHPAVMAVAGLALVLWGIVAAAGPDPPARAAGTAAVTIQGFAFSPATLQVAPGTTVTWTNRDAATHTVTSDTGAWPDSGGIATGGTFSYTFTAAGTYPYHCAIHPMMTATIVVTDATAPTSMPSDTATSAPPATNTATPVPPATNTATLAPTVTIAPTATAPPTATTTASRAPTRTATPAAAPALTATPRSGAGQPRVGPMGPSTRRTLQGFVGYFDGKPVRALATDTSSKAEAARDHLNYAPVLAGAPARTNPIYLVANGRFAARGAVFAAIPGDARYSPLHQEVQVTWKNAHAAVPLGSDTQIAALARAGTVVLHRTGIVLDCPIIAAASGR